ncbi:MAG: hypothetical protein H7647_03330 [Candidatus Heimdallarchaeota archaeon]|nr:hypothetical protein [Candidatus Heimdallarchaeota archaeon]MCK4253460.1 hypothetical protein [Candidatus Heimdallarchaeota archaeon]
MKIRTILGISLAVIFVVGGIFSTIWYFNFCDTCLIDTNNVNDSLWDDVIFSLINGSSYSISNFTHSDLLIEFASSDCSFCHDQIVVLKELEDAIILSNSSVLLLTLLIDLISPKDLLDYYIFYDISWTIGNISEEYYSLINLIEVPTFYFINTTKNLVGKYEGFTNLQTLKELIGLA